MEALWHCVGARRYERGTRRRGELEKAWRQSFDGGVQPTGDTEPRASVPFMSGGAGVAREIARGMFTEFVEINF